MTKTLYRIPFDDATLQYFRNIFINKKFIYSLILPDVETTSKQRQVWDVDITSKKRRRKQVDISSFNDVTKTRYPIPFYDALQ